MKCQRCKSTKIVKHGTAPRWKAGKKYRVQMYLCNNCGHQMVGSKI